VGYGKRGGYQPQHLFFFDDQSIDDISCGGDYCYVYSGMLYHEILIF
jgi:hypothetical protein